MPDQLPGPAIAERVGQLFATFHSRSQPEQTSAEAAAGVSQILGAQVPASRIDDVRHGSGAADPALLSALARHFGVSTDYLLCGSAETTALHEQLRLLASARDAGVRRLALRGGEPGAGVLDTVVSLLASLDADPPKPAT